MKITQLLTPLECLPKRWTASNLPAPTTKRFPFEVKGRPTVEEVERWPNPPKISQIQSGDLQQSARHRFLISFLIKSDCGHNPRHTHQAVRSHHSNPNPIWKLVSATPLASASVIFHSIGIPASCFWWIFAHCFSICV